MQHTFMESNSLRIRSGLKECLVYNEYVYDIKAKEIRINSKDFGRIVN